MLTNAQDKGMNIFNRLLTLTAFCIVTSGYAYAQFKDGVYYIQNAYTNMYLGSYGGKNAKAVLVRHGHPFIFTAVQDTTTKVEPDTQTESVDGTENDSEQQAETKPQLYIIDSHFFSSETNHYLGASNMLDEEATYWQIEATKDGTYTLSRDGKNYLASEGASTTIVNMTNPNSRKAQWKITREEDIINSFKGEDDATFLIRNSDLHTNFGPDYGESYWTINEASNTNGIILGGGGASSPCGIANHTTFDISQDVEGIPCGTYTLQAQCFYRLDGTRTSYIPELYLDDEAETFHLGTQKEASETDASNSFTLNLYDVKGLKTTTYNGKIVVGTRLERSEKLRSYWDNFVLTYVSDLDLDGYKKAYEESIKDAEATIEKIMNKDIKDSILTILQYKDTVAMTIESIKPYINTLNKARAECNKSAKYYEKVIKAYDIYTKLDEDGQAKFKELAAGIMDDYNNGAITNGKEEIKALHEIYLIALKSQIIPGTDMTDAIVNPTIDGSTGWTCERPNGGNGPLLNNVSFEYWAGNSIKLEDRSFNYYQTITGLQNGKYTVSCMAYNSKSSNDTSFAPSCGLYAFNGKDSVTVYVDTESSDFKEYTTPAIEALDNTLTIGVRNFTTMPARWFVADNFRLTLVSPDPALGIEATDDERKATVTGIYSINGIKRKELESGLNIVKYSNGKVVKKLK